MDKSVGHRKNSNGKMYMKIWLISLETKEMEIKTIFSLVREGNF
jgi:hypothetical protein